MLRHLFLSIFLLLLFPAESPAQTEVDLSFPLQRISAASRGKPLLEQLTVDFKLDESLGEQAYKVSRSGKTLTIRGGDKRGLLYGGLELAERIELYGTAPDVEGKPYLKKRGIKFNIPLDARTPSYDDTGDAAQHNIAEVWNWAFWEEFLDDMALHRYNALTLWNPHPFPSMIKLDGYPDVALDDVMATTLKPIGKENEWAEPQLVSGNVLANLKTVKTISIDDKIAFWRRVMAHAKKRGIDVYFITWNINPNSVAKAVPAFYRTYKPTPTEEAPGKYGISHQADDPETIAYHRAAVKQFLLTYPDLTGLGATAGEHMPDPFANYDREQWLWDTFGKGILDAKAEQPDRVVPFIHRVWNSNMDLIMKYWGQYPDPFDVSFKYAKARLYSTPRIPFATKHLAEMKTYGLKSWWNLRNDDIFVYRWGDPEYVRDFINHFPKDQTAAFHMGSDGYVWGREFIAKDSSLAGELEIKKHWYNFMLWGRLGYDNQLTIEFFTDKLAAHYPDLKAPLLHDTWRTASMIVPQVNRFYWKDWDFQWSVEACYNERSGFQTVRHFMDNPTMLKSNIINPVNYAKQLKGKGAYEVKVLGILPTDVARKLREYAQKTIRGVDQLRLTRPESVNSNVLLDDLLAMAHLGRYYADKIEAATYLAVLQTTKDEKNRDRAIKLLESAVGHWEAYARTSERHYRPQMLARTKMLDWSAILEDVRNDVMLAVEYDVE